MAKTLQIFTRTVLLLLVLQNISGNVLDVESETEVKEELAVEPPKINSGDDCNKSIDASIDAIVFFDNDEELASIEAEYAFAAEWGADATAGLENEDVEAMGEQLRREGQRVALSVQTTADSSCVLKVLGFYFDYLDRQHDVEYEDTSRWQDSGDVGGDSGCDNERDRDRDRGSSDSGDGNAGGGHGIGDYVIGDSALDRDGLVKLIAIELTRCLFASDGAMRRLGNACEGVGENSRRRRSGGNASGNGDLARHVNRCVASLSNDVVLWTTFNGYLGQVDTLLHRHFVQLDNVRLLGDYRQLLRTLHGHLAGRERTLDVLVVRLVRLARLFSETVPAAAAAAAAASASVSVAASVAASPVAPRDASGAAGTGVVVRFGQMRTILRRCCRLLFVCALPAVVLGFAGSVFGRFLANRRGARRAPPDAGGRCGVRTMPTSTPTRTMTISMRGGHADEQGGETLAAGTIVAAAATAAAPGTESFERAVLERAIALLVGGVCSYAVLHLETER